MAGKRTLPGFDGSERGRAYISPLVDFLVLFTITAVFALVAVAIILP